MSAEEKLAKIKQLLDEGCIKKSCLECEYNGLFSGCTELYLLDSIEGLVYEEDKEV